MSSDQFAFAPGDRVRFRDGMYAGFDAEVTEVDFTDRAVHVSLPIFGKNIPLRFSFEEATSILEREI